MPVVDRSLIDCVITVNDEESINMTRLLSKKEGIFAGFSSGANFMAAYKLLQDKEKGRAVGMVINDCGLKYMSTNLF